MSKTVPNTAETPLPAAVPPAGEIGPLVGKHYGGYEVASYIGEGPTGAVYRAEDLMGQRMAVKIMHRELSRRQEADTLWNELQALSSLGDEHFVRVYDSGFGDDGEFYFTMDELPGTDLEAALEDSGAFAPRRAVDLVDGIAAALERAHAAGIVHGGLKPRNVFLTPHNGRIVVKVLDFGAARLAGGVDKGVIVGNPFYMAPEQFGGQSDERTDVYSLGVLMYELFSGTLPFNGPTHGQVMMRHLAEPPQPPPGVDVELGGIILKALAKAPGERFQKIADLREALGRWAHDTRSLKDAAAHQVIARAAAARKMKQAALTTPDATAPMNKLDVAELAQATRQELEPANKKGNGHGRRNEAMNTTTRKDDNPNSSESVEASLEDFISKANASFPTSDGWDLHTGDVELIDDEDDEKLEEEQHVSAPIVVKPAQRKAETAAHLIKKADQSARSKKVTAAMLDDPNAATVVTQAPKRRPNPFEVQLPVEEEPAPLDPPPTGPRRRAERTEVVASPLKPVPWTANPLVWIAGVFAAFVAGALLVFVMVRTMMPSQPVVVQAPAPVVLPAAQPAAAAPVVTPLAPKVTPLEPKATPPAADVELAGTPKVAVEKPAAPAHHAKHAAKATREPAHAAAPRVAAARAEAPKKAAAAASDDDDDDSAPAAPAPKKAKAKAAKSAPSGKAKGGDWVDPFAQ